MKHIKKKFLKANKISNEVQQVLDKVNPNPIIIRAFEENNFEEVTAIIETDKGELIQAFKYVLGQQVRFIPEPNPITIYFDLAQRFYSTIEERKNEITVLISDNNYQVYDFLNKFNNYYASVSSCISFLYISIEAFINNLIPEDFTYINKKGEKFDMMEIQRNLSFEEKIKKVLPMIKDKSFVNECSHKYDVLLKLKRYRDEIIHTKANKINSQNFYAELFTQSLDFDYHSVIHSTKDFINFYEENLIEDCGCGKEH